MLAKEAELELVRLNREMSSNESLFGGLVSGSLKLELRSAYLTLIFFVLLFCIGINSVKVFQFLYFYGWHTSK